MPKPPPQDDCPPIPPEHAHRDRLPSQQDFEELSSSVTELSREVRAALKARPADSRPPEVRWIVKYLGNLAFSGINEGIRTAISRVTTAIVLLAIGFAAAWAWRDCKAGVQKDLPFLERAARPAGTRVDAGR